jgi:hypothetical protein
MPHGSVMEKMHACSRYSIATARKRAAARLAICWCGAEMDVSTTALCAAHRLSDTAQIGHRGVALSTGASG